MKLRSNKKGATLDNFYIAISFFGFAVVCLVISLFWSTVSTDANLNTDLWSASSIGSNIKQNAQDFFDDIDTWVVFIYIALHLGVLLTAVFLRSHPLVYVGGLFLIMILMLVASPIQDTWATVITDGEFSSVSGSFELTTIIMSNFVKLEMVFGFMTLILLAGLAKWEGIL